MKRLLSVLISALLLCSCGSHYEVRTDLSVYFSNADEVVERIREAMLKNRTVSIAYTSHGNNMSDIEAVVADLMSCVYDETDDPREGDYLRCRCSGYEMDYSYTEDSGSFEYTINISPSYITTPKQEALVDEAVKDIVSGLSGSEYDRVREVCEYLKDTVRYDKTAAKSESNKLKSSAYAAIVQHTAACRGYSAAAYRLLRECGIAVRVVTGTVTLPDGSTENHSWNIVCIDGSWYNMDITWDDQLGCEDYFLKSDSDIPDHKTDKEIQPISKESYK